MFYDIQLMDCLKQQILFDTDSELGLAYDHVGKHGAAFLQYTGLNDKNGKEIYEGDIVEQHRVGKQRYEITWSMFGGWGFKCDEKIYPLTHFKTTINEKIQLNGFEIIGNIYEHKDLLNGGK